MKIQSIAYAILAAVILSASILFCADVKTKEGEVVAQTLEAPLSESVKKMLAESSERETDKVLGKRWRGRSIETTQRLTPAALALPDSRKLSSESSCNAS